MRTTLVIVAGALLMAAPLVGQDAAGAGVPERAAAAWLTPRAPIADARLSLPIGRRDASPGIRAAEAPPRPSFVAVMLAGAAVGCVSGAVIMSSAGDVDDREKAAVRFNGCILGAPVGMLLGAAYGWASGARMP